MERYACPGCETGVIRVYKTKTKGFLRTRYVRCSDQCGWTGKQIQKLDSRGRIIFPLVPAAGNNVPNSTPAIDKIQQSNELNQRVE